MSNSEKEIPKTTKKASKVETTKKASKVETTKKASKVETIKKASKSEAKKKTSAKKVSAVKGEASKKASKKASAKKVSIKRESEGEDDEIERGDSEDEDPNEESSSLVSLESKYREQMRQIFPVRIDLPMYGLKNQIEAQIDLKPNFQRRNRWTNKDRSRFIESIIMNVPVPPVFLGEENYGKYVVLDGRQRLTAAYRFLSNDLVLEGLKIWNELNGKTYKQIQERGFAATIERRFLPGILLSKESSPEVKYEVFDRLNTGGIKANPMEVRNAVFPGDFNRLLHEASSMKKFRLLWGIPDSNDSKILEGSAFYRQMDDIAFVLRFFALRQSSLNGMKFKDYLSDFMSKRNKAYSEDAHLRKTDKELFASALDACMAVFGDVAFVKPDGTSRRSVPYAEAVMQALAGIPVSTLTESGSDGIRKGFAELLSNPQFKNAISTGTNGPAAIDTRITLAREVVATAMASDGNSKVRRTKKSARKSSEA
jgi:hypothetical protein